MAGWRRRWFAPAAALVLLAAGAAGKEKAAGRAVPAPSPQIEVRHADTERFVRGDYYLQGHVEVSYQGVKVTADQAMYNSKTGEVTATGDVTFSSPQAHLQAEEARYNVVTGRGWFSHAKGYVHPPLRPHHGVLQTSSPFYLRAQSVRRLDDSNYILDHGEVTTCGHPATGWTITTRKAHIVVNDKVVTHDAVIHFLRMPALYLPVMVTSIQRAPRRSGFLLPIVSDSSQKGVILGDSFFWVINPSADLTLGLENYSVRGLARMARFRARPSQDSTFNVNYFGVNDRGSGTLRQNRAPGNSLQATGEAENLWDGFRGVVDVDYVNSLAFRQTFSPNFAEAVSSEAHQDAFATKNFGAYSLNVDASRYQNFLSAQTPTNSVVINQWPAISFSGIDQQIKRSPLYFSFETSADGVSRDELGFRTPDFSDRLDFHPQLTMRLKSFLGFHFTPKIGARVTHYGTSLKPGQGSLNRLLGEVSLDLRPPSLEKVFSKPHFGYRFKHVIEPDIRYRLVRASDPQDISEIVRFDNLDVLTETNEIEYSVTNSILVRKDVPDGSSGTPQARDLISWRLAQVYYFDPSFGGVLPPGEIEAIQPTLSLTGFAFGLPNGRHLSPLVSVLKIAPSSNYDTELRTDLDPSGGGVLNAGITSGVHRGLLGLQLTDFFINRTASLPALVVQTTPTPLSQLPSFNLLRTLATYGKVDRKGLSGAFGIDYNFAQHLAAQVVGQASYNFGCFAVSFEYRRFDLGPLRRENQFRAAISFANIGTFGNFKSRERLF
jgi:LPS-assembly protein